MTQDEINAANDKLRQQAHADEISRRRDEQKQSPQERNAQVIEAMVEKAVAKAIKNAFDGFIIHSGNCMSFSGSGKNITGSWSPPPVTAPNVPTILAVVCVDVDGTPTAYNAQLNGILLDPVA